MDQEIVFLVEEAPEGGYQAIDWPAFLDGLFGS